MKHLFLITLYSFFVLYTGKVLFAKHKNRKPQHIELQRITKNTFLHISYLPTQKWGKVACNGLVHISNGEAIIFDTPIDDSSSIELIHWIKDKHKAKIVAVVVNHFHGDCLGGLKAFHNIGIPSYATEATRLLAQTDTINKPEIPKNGFNSELVLTVGKETVINKYFGEGHTKDNIVSYIPSEKVLFGGCLIKALKASKGNLADANTEEWSNTVRKVHKEFSAAKYVIPGHGSYGDTSLLTYTIQLFSH